jgi:hypothetical protein
MKTSRQDKLEARLTAQEAELIGLLRELLPRVANSGELLFFNSEFRPDAVQAHWLPQESEPLLQLAKESVALRERIGFPVLGSAGQLYLSACREAANSANDNRRGPRQLATWLLSELAGA